MLDKGEGRIGRGLLIQNRSSSYPSRILRLGKEGIWIALGQGVAMVGAFALVRMLTELLQPSEYGDLALGLTIATFVNQVAMGGITNGIVRFYSIAAEKGDLGGYARASHRAMGYATVVIVLIASILMTGLAFADAIRWLALASAVTLFSIVSGYSNVISGVQNAARQRAVVALHSGLDAWLRVGFSAAVVLWMGASSTAVVVGYILATLLILISQSMFLIRLWPNEAHSVGLRERWSQQMWSFSWPLIAGGIFNWGYFASQRWALEMFSTTENVGKLYALTQVAFAPAAQIGSLVLSFLGPILYARVGSATGIGRDDPVFGIVTRVVIVGLVCLVGAVAISYVWHREIFSLFVAKEYQDVSAHIPFVVFAAGAFQISAVLGLLLTSANRTKRILPLATFGNMLVIGLNFSLTYHFGFDGLVASLFLGSILHLVWMYGLTRFN